VIFLPASRSPSDFPPLACCWTVFIVSNGASIVLEQAAASPEASVFFSPSVTAFDVDFFDVALGDVEAANGDGLIRPPRGMLLSTDLDEWTSLVMLNNLADAMAVCVERRNSESRNAALVIEEMIGLGISMVLGKGRA